MVIAKFGGTSLATAEQCKKVINIIQEDAEREVIVVSAPGKRDSKDIKVTDMLIQSASMDPTSNEFTRLFKQIKDRFFAISQGFGLNELLSEEFAVIEDTIAHGVNKDYIVSRGEYLNARMMAEILGYPCIDAYEIIKLTDDGLIDNESYALIQSRILKTANSSKERYVIPGFYGKDG